jgi:adenylate cyclase class 2
VIEIELKARLRDRAATVATVSAFAGAGSEVDKSDEYWRGPDWRASPGARDFRLRVEGGSSTVNFKAKRSEGGIEVNRESEFDVSNRPAFVEFIRRLGCEPHYAKRKRGLKFSLAEEGAYAGPATIEILEVPGLGDFIEIEILLEWEDPAAVERAGREIRALLSRSGVSEEAVESRFYSELLTEAGLVDGS